MLGRKSVQISLTIFFAALTILTSGTGVPLSENVCYETTWQCYGAQTSMADLYEESTRGPLTYVDGQETTTISGHVSQLEYSADVTGVEIRFLILELTETYSESQLRIVHSFTDTALQPGLNTIYLDIDVRAGSRIGFQVISDSEVPMRYREGKVDGNHYMSFVGPARDENILTLPGTSVNRQYAFRICYDMSRDETECPYTDPCSVNPCKHGGTCSADGDDEITCLCPPGFAGDRCQIDPCGDDPCMNGGTCSPKDDAFTCYCSEGFSGSRCEVVEIESCYETTWQCYGAHTSHSENFNETSQGPIAYVDGQETTTISGHVSELEYYADVTRVEIRFMILEVGAVEHELTVVHSFRHTATFSGLIKVPLDIEVKARSRIGFQVGDNEPVPMRFRVGKLDGTHYASFVGAPQDADDWTFPSTSVNRQYNFRICFDLARNELLCPHTPAPIVDPCSPNPCLNGGTCRAGGKEGALFTCKCPYGYLGDTCETDARYCYETTWQCHGAHTSRPDHFTQTSRGPLAYVDGQETTAISGHVAELEYIADVTGVPVRFLILELEEVDGVVAENVLRVVHSFWHTASNTGLVTVPLDLNVNARSRIAFEVYGDNPVPMKYRTGKLDGTHYRSFMDLPGNPPNPRTFNSTSVNMQYAFRICFDLALNEVRCPLQTN